MNILNKVILSCLLLLLASCANNINDRSSYFFDNITQTRAYNTLDKMNDITKVWIYYDRAHSFGRSHLPPEDGIGFEGEGFFGSVLIEDVPYRSPRNFSVDVTVYAVGWFVYRDVAPWGPDKRFLRIQKIKEKIKESLFDTCNK
jgi:hypothetical protein